MNGLYLQSQYEELWKYNTKKWEEGKWMYIYIVDQNHQISVIVVDHSRNFKGI